MPKPKDLAGRRFERLTVIKKTNSRRSGSIVWECRCDCGNICHSTTSRLIAGQSKSCGCLRLELSKEKLLSAQDFLGRIDATQIPSLNNKPYRNNSSGVRGVYWNTGKNKWQAYIRFKRKRYHLGYFDDKADAINARKQAEEELWKPFIQELIQKSDRKED